MIFRDEFDGSSIDPTKWNVSVAVAGNRWCEPSSTWIDVGTDSSCVGVTESPPFGSISVNAGVAQFASAWIRCYPYVWRGPPTQHSPFPPAGDFELTIRMRFDVIERHGAGIYALYMPDSRPIGSNSPVPPAGDVPLELGASAADGMVAVVLGNKVPIPDWNRFHDFELRYVAGSYLLYVDGTPMLGPIASPVRPNTIWMGDPVFTWWAVWDWCDFTVDSICVRAL